MVTVELGLSSLFHNLGAAEFMVEEVGDTMPAPIFAYLTHQIPRYGHESNASSTGTTTGNLATRSLSSLMFDL